MDSWGIAVIVIATDHRVLLPAGHARRRRERDALPSVHRREHDRRRSASPSVWLWVGGLAQQPLAVAQGLDPGRVRSVGAADRARTDRPARPAVRSREQARQEQEEGRRSAGRRRGTATGERLSPSTTTTPSQGSSASPPENDDPSRSRSVDSRTVPRTRGIFATSSDMFSATTNRFPRLYTHVPSGDARCVYVPERRSALLAPQRDQVAAQVQDGPRVRLRWSATLHRLGCPNGSQGVTPELVNPAPAPGVHCIGVRPGSRPGYAGQNRMPTGSRSCVLGQRRRSAARSRRRTRAAACRAA